MKPDLPAREIIRMLDMRAHPEGGWYRETFRDADGGSRGYSTAIYYLLEQGARSRWHRVTDATEIWHWHGGAPLCLMLSPDGRSTRSHRLGMGLEAGERPQCVVPANCWQTAETLGAWTLVGCTVSPGFDFAAFEMAEENWQPAALIPESRP